MGFLEGRALACVAALAVVAAGAAAPPVGSERSAAAVLAAHCRARAALSTLRARFVQRKVFAAVGDEDRSAGILYYRKPDALRWEYTEPDPSFTVIRGGKGWAVFPRIRQVQRFALDPSRAETLFSIVGFGACGEAFQDSFEVALAPGAGAAPVLSLVPRRGELAGAFERIELTLDPGDALPRAIVLHERTGDSVSIELHDVKRGVPIEGTLFEFAAPRGYSVVP